jgi:hypothetical protein
MNNTRQIKTFIGAMMAAAVITAGYAGLVSHALHTYFALAVLVLAAVTSRMKVKLPGINGNMSVNLPFLLTAVVSLSAVEAVVITCISTAVQCWPRKGAKFNPQQMMFNPSMMAFASCLASLMFHAEWLRGMQWSSSTLGLVLATATLFLGQTAPVAAIVAVSEGKAAGQIWWGISRSRTTWLARESPRWCRRQVLTWAGDWRSRYSRSCTESTVLIGCTLDGWRKP